MIEFKNVLKEKMQTHRVIFSLIMYTLVHLPISYLYMNPVDVYVQYVAALDIVKGYELYDTLQAVEGKPYPTYPPLYLHYLALLFFLFGGNIYVLKTQLIVVNVLLAYVFYKICYKLFDENSDHAFYALILFLISPVNYIMVYAGFFDNFVILFICLSLYFTITEHRFSPTLAGFFLSVSIMSKQFGIIYIPICLLYYWFKNDRYILISRYLVSLITTTVLIALPFLNRPRFIKDLIYHLNDDRPSISWQYRIFPALDPYSLLIQFIAMATVFFVMLYFLQQLQNSGKLETNNLNRFFIWSIHTITLIFMLFNRIVYPHYLPYLSYLLPFVIIEIYKAKELKIHMVVNLLFYSILSNGLILYGYSWIINDFQYERSEFDYYYVSAIIYNGGMLLYTCHTLYIQKTLFNYETPNLE